jgi:hypothetical protein
MTQTAEPYSLYLLSLGLAAVASHLEPEGAAPAAFALIRAMAGSNNTYTLPKLARSLAAILTGGARTLPVRVAGLVGGVAASDRQPPLAPAALALALEPPRCPLSTQELVELLKHPLCVGQARRVVLEQLENRYRRPFADHWEFVRFAQQQNLGLDFTTPPRRTEALLPDVRK